MSLLVHTVEQYGNTTHFTLADSNELMDFMGQTACQAKLNSIWKGRMALYTSTLKVGTSPWYQLEKTWHDITGIFNSKLVLTLFFNILVNVQC